MIKTVYVNGIFTCQFNEDLFTEINDPVNNVSGRKYNCTFVTKNYAHLIGLQIPVNQVMSAMESTSDCRVAIIDEVATVHETRLAIFIEIRVSMKLYLYKDANTSNTGTLFISNDK